MKKITLLLSFIACVVLANAQVLLVENFNYTIGTDIKSQGWPIHSGINPNDSILVTDGLTFSGYPGSGIGGAAALTSYTKDQNKTFTAQTSGVIYASFMVKAGSANKQGYFFHLSPSPVGTTFITRVWINSAGTGTGIGSYSSGLEPSPYVPLTPNTTYVLVVKFDFSTKVSSLYVLSTIPTNEPATAQATYTETATLTNVGAVCLRQYTWTGSTTNQNVIVDGIRVATSWNALFSTADVNTPSADKLNVTVAAKKLTVTNAPSSNVEIFNTLGKKVQSLILVNGSANLNLPKGIYFVRAGEASAKFKL